MGHVCCVHFLDNILAAGCKDGIKVWDLKDYTSFELRGHTEFVSSVQVVSSTLLLSGSVDGTVKLWNLNSRTVSQTIDVGTSVFNLKALLSLGQSNVNDWTSLPPGKLYTRCEDGTVKIYDTKSGDLLKLLDFEFLLDFTDADDSRILCACNENDEYGEFIRSSLIAYF
jgi:WD40 repeat protein